MNNFWLNRFPAFNEVMNKQDKTNLEKLLLQCIASLSTQGSYCHLTPQQVYEKQVKYTKDVNGLV